MSLHGETFAAKKIPRTRVQSGAVAPGLQITNLLERTQPA